MANETTIPDTTKKPADHLQAVKAEANNERPALVTVTILGEDFEVAPDYFDDLEVVEALEDGHLIAVLRDLFGRDGYVRLKEALKAEHGGRAPASSLDVVFEAVMAQMDPTGPR